MAVLGAEELDRRLGAYRLGQAVYAFTALGIPDLMAAGCATSAELARQAGCVEPLLHRLLRALASEGVLTQEGDCFGLTPASSRLASEAPSSIRAMLLGWRLLPEKYAAFGSLAHTVRTGEPAFDHRYGTSFHKYLAEHPDVADAYQVAMSSTTDGFDAAAAAYDFSEARTVVDVGGGRGDLLVSVLARNPGIRGVLFDLPGVVADAPAALAGAPEAARIDVVGGDMFSAVPVGGDIYLFSTVLRCYDDDACIRVLHRCRDAMADGGRVLAIEMRRPDGPWTSPTGLADLEALVTYGGIDRTDAEWSRLFDRAGFELTRVVPIDENFAILEARLRVIT